MGGVGRTFVLEVLGVVTLLEVDVAVVTSPFSLDELGETLVIEADEGDREEGTCGVALLSEAVPTDKVDHTPLVVELGDLRVRVGVDEARRPVEVLRLDVLRGDAELKTTGHHLCDVGRTDDRTTDTLRDHRPHFIEVTTGVGIEGEAEAIIEEPCGRSQR